MTTNLINVLFQIQIIYFKFGAIIVDDIYKAKLIYYTLKEPISGVASVDIQSQAAFN